MFFKSPFLNLFINYPEIYANYLNSSDTLKVSVKKIYDIKLIMEYVECQEITVIFKLDVTFAFFLRIVCFKLPSKNSELSQNFNQLTRQDDFETTDSVLFQTRNQSTSNFVFLLKSMNRLLLNVSLKKNGHWSKLRIFSVLRIKIHSQLFPNVLKYKSTIFCTVHNV